MTAEDAENTVALQTMRGFLTTALLGNAAVSALTHTEVSESVLQHEGVYSYELLQELKNNKCLHWCIKHVGDIASASFLSGEAKVYFESIETMDIVECRALVKVLAPLTKFNNDSDGKKWAWRNRLFAKCKGLLDQLHGVEVKGPWNAAEGKRSLVKLPALTPGQLRRPVYFHKTHAQFKLKLKQYDDKLALLAKKEGWLAAAKKEMEEAVSEWSTLISELRDEKLSQLLAVYSKDQIESTACTILSNPFGIDAKTYT